MNEKIYQQLKSSKLHVINNGNIKEKQLGKRRLHLNTRGNILHASNVLHALKKTRNTDHNDSHFIDNNVFFVNTDSESDLLRKSVPGDKKINNLESDVSGLINLRNEFPNKPTTGYININTLGNTINYLREVFLKCPFDIVCIDETKIQPSFPDAQFHIDRYQFPPLMTQWILTATYQIFVALSLEEFDFRENLF